MGICIRDLYGIVNAMLKIDLKMRIFSKLFCLVILTVGSTSSGLAATLNVPCDFLSISNACMTANEGDIVWIQAGRCYLSNTITINRNISFWIKGTGSNMTTLIGATNSTMASGDGSFGSAISLLSDSTNVFSISDLNLIGGYGNNNGFLNIGAGLGIWPRACPGAFHIYNIQMTNVMGRGIQAGANDTFGLIDHSVFWFSPNVGQSTTQPISFEGNRFYSFSNAIPYGTTNVVCIEDCLFVNSYYANPQIRGGNGFWDGYDGMQAVIRHCVFNGDAANGTHGYDSGLVSARSSEVYNNIFTNVTYASGLPIGSTRGGGFMMFSNLVYMADVTTLGQASPILLTYYRAGCLDNFSANPWASSFLGFCGYDATYSFTNIDNINYQVTAVFYPGATPWVKTNIMIDRGSIQFGMWYPYYLRTDISGGADCVQVGASLSQTLTNIMLCVNAGGSGPFSDTVSAGSPGYGTAFNVNSHRNHDFICTGITTNSLTFHNIMDGTGTYSWPAAMQEGVLQMVPYTNTGVTLFPCYSWSNTVYGSNGVVLGTQNFTRSFTQPLWCSGKVDNVTNLLVQNRDYYQDTIAPTYTPLAYPHPLQAFEVSGTSFTTTPPERLNANPGP
jgi:hypothetical protein